MNYSLILETIGREVRLNEEEAGFLESVLISRPFKQSELIIKSGETARYLMFVNAGYIMSYYSDKEGTDHVIQFASTGWWGGDIYSFSAEPTTIFSTKALCDGELLLLPRSAHDQLFDKYPVFEKYFRIHFQRSVIRNQLRFIENYSAKAEERYQAFLQRFPGMEQYVPQKYIASYLGITPEFLSKIRKRSTHKQT
jgi:CRP/FNR family transcriptional regulator, anaerobic regulatory protein